MSTEKLESISRVKITRLSPILDPENLENSARNPTEPRALLQDAPRNLFRTVYWVTLRNCSHLRIILTSTCTRAEPLLDDGVCAVSTSLSEPLADVRPAELRST